MDKVVEIRDLRVQDYPKIEEFIGKTWNFQRFCGEATARKLAQYYLSSCLVEQTFTKVATIDDQPIGIIMGNHIQQHKTPLKYRLRLIKSFIQLLFTKEGLKIMSAFKDIANIDEVLLKESPYVYDAELTFFAVDETCRGLGVGKQLHELFLDYLKNEGLTTYYLFTDTDCNFGFYESRGIKRRNEHQHQFNIDHVSLDVDFYLYDNIEKVNANEK